MKNSVYYLIIFYVRHTFIIWFWISIVIAIETRQPEKLAINDAFDSETDLSVMATP